MSPKEWLQIVIGGVIAVIGLTNLFSPVLDEEVTKFRFLTGSIWLIGGLLIIFV